MNRGAPRILLPALLLCLASPFLSAASEYYVSPAGNNTDDGLTTNTAWQTITHALAEGREGDTIRIGPGSYSEWLIVSNALTLIGADTYDPAAPPFSRHTSLTLVRPPYPALDSALVEVRTNGVVLMNLTLIGDADTNGTPDASHGVYGRYRPLTIDSCTVRTFNGYGIRYVGDVPLPVPGDSDSVRGHLYRNRILDITHTNAGQATGIFIHRAPSLCLSNDVAGITGAVANAGVYVYHAFGASAMSTWPAVSDNTFSQCLVGVWANSFGSTGDSIRISGNRVIDGLVGIRITGANGPAILQRNRIAVSGVSPSSATPARGIWIQGDQDPWGQVTPSAETGHRVDGNRLEGSATTGDKTTGIRIQYDTPTWPDHNNGVLVSITSNAVVGFDIGMELLAGNTGVTIPHNPLVDPGAVLTNSFEALLSYSLLATGVSQTVLAPSNWWDSYHGPSTNPLFPPTVSANVLYTPWTLGWYGADTDQDGTDNSLDADDDADGWTDAEEVFTFETDPVRVDTDGDRCRDRDEWVAGTDPTNRFSVFAVSNMTSLSSTSVELVWPSVAGRIYQVSRGTNLWEGFPSLLTNMAATPPTNRFVDAAAPAAAFYRLTVTN